MPFAAHDPLRYFYFEVLQHAGLVHGFFTREGGVSPQPWGSLNAGSRVGDAPDRVIENLSRAARALGRDPGSLTGVRQVHGNTAWLAERPAAAGSPDPRLAQWDSAGTHALVEADAVVTRDPAVTLFMRFADCVPILLFDPDERAAGIVHAGWRGTVGRAAASAVRKMTETFGSEPGSLLAGIGPSICRAHYEVGGEVIGAVRAVFNSAADRVLRPSGDRSTLDLWAANRIILEEAGVRRIETAGECTAERADRWYSHRAEGGATGRFAVLAGLVSDE